MASANPILTGTAGRAGEIIRRGIRSGFLAPGQHLVEVDITARFKISRSSFREALQPLVSEGLIALHRYRGASICILSRRAIDDLLEVLEPLVQLAAFKASLAGDFEGKQRLSAIAGSAVSYFEGPGTHSTQLALRRNFYEVLFRMAGNSELPRVTPLGRADLLRTQVKPYQPTEEQRRHVEGYVRIAEAIVAERSAVIEKMVAAHFAETRAMIGRLPPGAFGDEA